MTTATKLERLQNLLGDEIFNTAPEHVEVPEQNRSFPTSPLEVPLPDIISLMNDNSQHPDAEYYDSDGSYCARVSNLNLSENPHEKKHLEAPKIPLADGRTEDSQGRQLGEEVESDMVFCPILAVSKYPYRYMTAQTADSEKVSQHAFANDKFWNRKWTIFYIHPPPTISEKPLLLVPAREVKALLDEINYDLSLLLDFPRQDTNNGFLNSFPNDGTPLPRYLGVSFTKASFKTMEKQVPAEDLSINGAYALAADGDNKSLEAFKERMRLAVLATKNKSKASGEGKKLSRVQQKDRWCRQLKRTQRYLGLRPRVSGASDEEVFHKNSLTWEEYVLSKERQSHMPAMDLGRIAPFSPAPHTFDGSMVFISVDIESWERSHSQITEIGISTLDSSDLRDCPPGTNGINWMSKIRSRHFLIKEHRHLVNKDFIVGCPDRFEKKFGKSENISLYDSHKVIASCFRPPFSATSEVDDCGVSLRDLSVRDRDEKRNIVLVGHDTKTDINYMRTLGFDAIALSNVIEVLDTSEMYCAMKHETNRVSLGSILSELGIVGWNLHNAGNDAAYTLQAMIGISFLAFARPNDRQPQTKDLIEKAADEARERAKEGYEEWEIADGNDDGGSPEKDLKSFAPKAENSKSTAVRGNRGGRASSIRGVPRGPTRGIGHYGPLQARKY